MPPSSHVQNKIIKPNITNWCNLAEKRELDATDNVEKKEQKGHIEAPYNWKPNPSPYLNKFKAANKLQTKGLQQDGYRNPTSALREPRLNQPTSINQNTRSSFFSCSPNNTINQNSPF